MWEYVVPKSFTKIVPHNSLLPQPFLRFSHLSASAVLGMWLLQSLTVPFHMAEHSTYCARSIQSNRNMALQGYLTQEQSNEIIVPLSHKMALVLGWQLYIMKNMCWNNACEVNGSLGVRWGTVHFSRDVFGWEFKLGLIVCPWVNKAIIGYWDCWLQTDNALCVSMTFYNHEAWGMYAYYHMSFYQLILCNALERTPQKHAVCEGNRAELCGLDCHQILAYATMMAKEQEIKDNTFEVLATIN